MLKTFISGHGLTVSSAYHPAAKGNNRGMVLMQDGANPPKLGLKHYICRVKLFGLAQGRFQEQARLRYKGKFIREKITPQTETWSPLKIGE